MSAICLRPNFYSNTEWSTSSAVVLMYSIYDYVKQYIFTNKIDRVIIDQNMEIIYGEKVTNLLRANRKSPRGALFTTSQCIISCCVNTGEIYPCETIGIMFKNDPNCWIYTMKPIDSEYELYYMYPTLHCTSKCIRNLVATEFKLNGGPVDANKIYRWKISIKHKIETIKFKYGVLEAIKWNTEYKLYIPSDKLFTLRELVNLSTEKDSNLTKDIVLVQN